MKRVLFVDDEQNILDGLRDILRKHRRDFDMAFALGGEAALQELRRTPSDVIVTDMRMPGIDGATLLSKVREEFPAMVRIILSGQSGSEAIFRALPAAHQFLAKPCDADKLYDVVIRACNLHARLNDGVMRKALGRINRLPTLPAAYRDLMKALGDPDLSVHGVGLIVERDTALCAKLLQLVNSSCFGTLRSITRIDHAVTYLGLDLIKNLTLSANVFLAMEKTSALPGFSFEEMQDHAVLTARVVKRLVSDPRKASDAFAVALLHDIGYHVLASCIPDEFRAFMGARSRIEMSTCEMETAVFGVSHAEAGAYLLSLWGLPFSVIEGVAWHHDPKASGETLFDVTSAVAVADVLADRFQQNRIDEPLPAELMEHLHSVGADSSLSDWKAIAVEEGRKWQAGK